MENEKKKVEYENKKENENWVKGKKMREGREEEE